MEQNIDFIPVKAGRASEEVALQLEAAVLEGKILPGDRLSSERELQNIFHTGRGVIREAFKILKQKGLIEIRKGAHGGAFVKEAGVASASESLALFLKQTKIEADYIIEFRESIDRTITTLAIARGTGEEKKALLKYADELRTAAAQSAVDLAILIELDRQLNLSLARMTGNPVFEWIMQALQLGFNSLDVALYEDLQYRQKTVDNWYATALLISKNETLRALTSIDMHYHYLRQCTAGNDIKDSSYVIENISTEEIV